MRRRRGITVIDKKKSSDRKDEVRIQPVEKDEVRIQPKEKDEVSPGFPFRYPCNTKITRQLPAPTHKVIEMKRF